MTIAEQLTQTMEPLLDAVYAAGKAAGGGGVGNPADVLQYATTPARLFYKAVFPALPAFPDGYELVLDMPNCTTDLKEMFRMAGGLRKLTLNVPTNKSYNVSYFAYDNSDKYSTLKEIVLPNGIKFSNFSYFANRNSFLKTVSGAIDLSESTSNENCFAYCPELVDVEFVLGKITKSISFAQSTKLSHASITSIMNALSAAGAGQTVTLSKEAVDTAFQDFQNAEGDNPIVIPGSNTNEWNSVASIATEELGWAVTLV